MNTEKMREEFEAWAYSVGFDIRARDGSYLEDNTADVWLSWQASRESLVITLPDPEKYYSVMGDCDDPDMLIDHRSTVEAIHATGVKTK